MMIIQDNYVIIKLSSHINVCVNINKAIVCTSLKIGAEVRIYMKHHQLNLFFPELSQHIGFPSAESLESQPWMMCLLLGLQVSRSTFVIFGG